MKAFFMEWKKASKEEKIFITGIYIMEAAIVATVIGLLVSIPAVIQEIEAIAGL